MRRRLVSLTCLLLARVPASAQPSPPTNPPPEPAPADADTPAEADKPPTVEERLKALELDLEDVRGENEDLRSEVADLRQQQAASRPPPSPSALNPAITAFLNGAMRIDDSAVYTPEGVRIDHRPFLRSADFDFRAAVDPYADAVAIVTLEDEAGEGFGVDLEEGYVVLKRLPILETAPLGLKLKLGRYRPPIGSVNRIHLHDLPWTTHPLPISRYLGTENGEFFESGLGAVGVDAEMLLPEFIQGVAMELNADVIDGGNIAIADTHHRHPGYLGHYNAFFTVADAHDFNIGLSAYFEPGRHQTSLFAADVLYKWKPIRAGEFHSFVLGGEAFYVDRKFADEMNATVENKPFGWFAFAQYQLSWHVYLGGRYDYVEDIADKSVKTQVAAGYLSYYTSEFLRFRAGYEHRWSDVPADDGIHSFIAEVNVVFGSHPTEPYWVNR